MNYQRLAKKQTGLGPPIASISGTANFENSSKIISGISGVLCTTQLIRGCTISGTGIQSGTRVLEILNDTTVVIDLSTTASGIASSITFDEIFPYGSVATDGTSIFLSGKDHRPIDIGTPVGIIVGWHPRLFSAAGNVGIDSSDRTTLPDNYKLCDGSNISSTGSPLVNGSFNRLPDLTDNRFLMGGISTTFLGDNFVYGGSNHSGPPLTNSNNGDNSITVGSANLPLHVHEPGTYDVLVSTSTSVDGSHGHTVSGFQQVAQAGIGTPYWYHSTISGGVNGFFQFGTDGAGSHSHTISTNGVVSGNSGDGSFANDAISVLPRYLMVKYIMRIK